MLQEFMRDKIVLGEVADVLNMHLFALSLWLWPEEGVLVEIRRHPNGRYPIFMDEDIIQAMFLHFIGLKWSVEFKGIFTNIFDSLGLSHCQKISSEKCESSSTRSPKNTSQPLNKRGLLTRKDGAYNLKCSS